MATLTFLNSIKPKSLPFLSPPLPRTPTQPHSHFSSFEGAVLDTPQPFRATVHDTWRLDADHSCENGALTPAPAHLTSLELRLTAPQASSTASTTTPLRHAFDRRAEDVKPLKRYVCLSPRGVGLDLGFFYYFVSKQQRDDFHQLGISPKKLRMRRTNLVVYLICCYEPNTIAP